MSPQATVWIAQGVFCPMCRGKHDLCFSHAPEASGVYRLTCPTTRETRDIQITQAAVRATACPAQGVRVDGPRPH